MPKTILVTGAAGFIGSNLATAAQSIGWQVVGLDRGLPDSHTRAKLGYFVQAALGTDSLASVLGEWAPDYCIHCAGPSSVPQSFKSPSLDFERGPRATFHLLDQLRCFVPKCRTVLLSSAAVYGNPSSLPIREDHPVAPISPYGWHKWLSEKICTEFVHLFESPIAIARIFSAYGPGLRRQVVWDVCEKFAAGAEVVLQGTGTESRDFIYIDDIVRGLLTIAERGEMVGTAYNVATGQEVAIRCVAHRVRQELGLTGHPFRFAGDLPVGTPSRWQADISALGKLGFEPQIDFAHGIEGFVVWWKQERAFS